MVMLKLQAEPHDCGLARRSWDLRTCGGNDAAVAFGPASVFAGGVGRKGLALAPRQEQRHSRHVRHARQADLDRVEALLGELRKLPQLRERQRGNFSRGARAFLHFHEDAGDLYVDVRLDSAFQRMKVTSLSEQADFLAQVRQAVQSAS